MSSKKDTYKQIREFNEKTFQEKAKRRRLNANLPFAEKLKIVEELNTLIEDFARKRTKRKKGIIPRRDALRQAQDRAGFAERKQTF